MTLSLAVIGESPANKATVVYKGATTVQLPEGTQCKFKFTGPIDDLFNEEVPAGKRWELSAVITIKEIDV